MSGDKDRLNRILEELNHEIEPEIKESQKRESHINDKLRALQDRMLLVIKSACYESYNWFEKNKANLGKMQSDPEAQKQMSDLEKCASRFDYGIRDHMMNAEKEIMQVSENHSTCAQSCIKDEHSDDTSIKRCFKNCFGSTFKKTDVLQNNLLLKIDEVISNLNKI